MWAKPDQALEPRVLQSFLFAVKRLLVDWGFEKRSLWVDTDAGTLWLGDEVVVAACVRDRRLALDYGTDWQDYLSSPDWRELEETANQKLSKGGAATKGVGKTKGKTKSKGAPASRG